MPMPTDPPSSRSTRGATCGEDISAEKIAAALTVQAAFRRRQMLKAREDKVAAKLAAEAAAKATAAKAKAKATKPVAGGKPVARPPGAAGGGRGRPGGPAGRPTSNRSSSGRG